MNIKVELKTRVFRKDLKELEFQGVVKNNILNIGYGYKTTKENRCVDGEKYTLHNSITPIAGDRLLLESGEVLIVGEKSGFVSYSHPLFNEQGARVATLIWEDYYKD